MASGAAYRSDVEAGYALGEAVARRVLQRAATDGADKVWDGVMPTGAYVCWRIDPARHVKVPFDALAGTWQTWVIPSGSALVRRLSGAGSAAWLASMNELRMLAAGGRTVVQMDRARFWATKAPTARWDLFVEEELARRRWSLRAPARARVWVSMADAAPSSPVDAKFHTLARPRITVDPTMNTIFSTPPLPSVPLRALDHLQRSSCAGDERSLSGEVTGSGRPGAGGVQLLGRACTIGSTSRRGRRWARRSGRRWWRRCGGWGAVADRRSPAATG